MLAAVGASGAAAAGTVTRFPASGELRVAKVVVRARPDVRAPAVAVLTDFRADFRKQIILATEVAKGTRNPKTRWYRVLVPGRPNGRRGWIKAGAARLRPTNAEIVVKRGERVLELYRRGERILRTRVAVGKPGAETPLGLYYVTWAFRPSNGFLGVWALETSAYSRLSDWPGGGIVGIHGTSAPYLLGQAVSHGCVRVENAAALVLRKHAPLGTPIRIVA